MKKRIISLLLAVSMVVTLLPVTAWAEEISPVQDSRETAPTLSVGVDSITNSSAALTFTGSADGTVYYLVQKSEEAATDETAILAGETVAATAGAAITAELAGLEAETDYTAYGLLESGDKSRSAIASARFTTGAAVPMLMKARALGAGVSYMDENGVEQEKPAAEVTEITDTDIFTSLNTGWYVVNGDIRNLQITVAGDVALILADGCTLTVPYGIIAAGANRLSIYGQADGTGRLIANGGPNSAGIGGGWGGAGGTVNVYGGTVNATGHNGAGIGGGPDGIGAPAGGPGGTVNVYGGTVNATGYNGAGIGGAGDGNGGTVNIYGGTVNATGINGCAGIGSGVGGNGGTVTISGGTVMAAAISSYGAADIGGGNSAPSPGSCVITGGSVRAAFTSSYSPTPIDGAANPVSLTTVTLGGVSLPTAIQSLNVTGVSYGVNGMETVAGDKLYLWLPDGAAVTAATAGGRSYAGSVSAGASGVLILSDTTLPTVASVTPSGPDTPISGNLVITFSEAMNPSAGAVSLDGGITSLTGGGWTVDSTVYTVPYSLLGYSTAYTLSISGFKDTAGNTMTADTSHSFTTIPAPDTTSPTVVSVTPNGTNTAISGNIVITFNEAMNTSSGAVSLDGGITSLTGGGWTVGSTVYTVPYSLLGYSTAYTLSISGFKDMAGNTMTADTSHSFTTIPAPDTTNPTVASVTPSGADNAISGNIVITFNEAMNTSSGAVSLDGGITSLTGGGWTVGNTVYTVPYSLLGYSTEYTLSISGFEDTAGNTMTANTSHSFTTVAEPLTPSVSANTLSVKQGGTTSVAVSLGQGGLAATAADITVANGGIASVSTGRVTAPGTVTVTGLAAGTTGITVTFNDPANTVVNIAVTVSAASIGGNTNSGNNFSSSSTLVVQEKQPDYPVTAEISVHATVDKNGHATATIPESAIADAIRKAVATAKPQGKAENGIGISVTVSTPANTKSLGLVLSQSVLRQLVDAKVQQLEINGQILTLNFNRQALEEIRTQSTGDVTITVKPVTVKGVRSAYEITISFVKDGKTVKVTSLGSGGATLSIPCIPGKNEVGGYLYAVYVDAKGKLNRIPGSAYDANSKRMIVSTNHFSVYGVGYAAPSAKFTDIGSHWAKESIDYVVGRGLLSGTSKTIFAPDTAMTRGMLVTAFGRLAGVDTELYTTNSFTDVKANSTFHPCIEWARSKGIIQGIGNGQFSPDRAITREEIAVIFANYAKATGYKLPVTRTATAFADAASIGSVYKDAVTAMQQAGIMLGETNNKFNPKSNATRAQVSSMLHRYIKLTIDPATAQGWAKNDDGQYMYYKDSKPLTGWQPIEGGKYFFNTDGTLKTGWVKDGDNWRYYFGNKAAMGWLDISGKSYYFTKDGLMVSGKWLEIGGKWYYFHTDGSMTKNTKIGAYEVDANGVRKTK